MSEFITWESIKAARPETPEQRRGYERAGRAIRVAREVYALRQRHGLSQRQLAELVGTTQSAIARLESGVISPSLPTLDRIANALGAELHVTFTEPAAQS